MPSKPTKPTKRKPAEPPKALAKTHGPRPRVDLISLGRAAGKTAVGLIPGVGKLVDALRDAEARTRTKRLKTWSAYVEGGEDADSAFVDRIAEVLQGDEADGVRSAIMESAKAANDAVIDDVVPSIGILTRRFLAEGVPQRRLYRSVLEFLRRLDEEEFDGIRRAMNHLAAIPNVDPFRTDVTREHSAGPWHWMCRTKNVPLIVGDHAQHVARALQVILIEHADLATPANTGSSILMPRSLVELLASIMPPKP